MRGQQAVIAGQSASNQNTKEKPLEMHNQITGEQAKCAMIEEIKTATHEQI